MSSNKSDDSWYCGAFASLSGQDKKEWEERVTHQLAAIRTDLNQIKAGIGQIVEGQQTIFNQNQQILVRFDELGPEAAIGKSLARIRVLFNEQFTPLFTGQRPFTGPALTAFARKVIFEEKIDQQLGIIDDQLTQADFGRDPLLRTYAKRMNLKMEAAKSRSLAPAYDYLESVADNLLAEQRKGYLMYTWAATTLESLCKVDSNQCADVHRLPHTAVQYREIFAQHLRAQTAELSAALEWLVLANSDVHSRQPNFLHPEAERLFRLSDFKKSGVGSREGEMATRTCLLIDTDVNGRNGILWEKNTLFASAISERLQGARESARINVTAGAPYNVILGGGVKLNVQTSGPGNTNFLAAAIAKIDNAYVSQ